MSGLALIIPGAGPGTGPVVPIIEEPLHSAGVEGYAHRWVADRIQGNIGDSVSTWQDAKGTNNLSAGNLTVPNIIQLAEQSSRRYVHMVQNTASLPYLRATQSYTRPGTLAIVCRLDTANLSSGTRNAINDFGVNMGRAANDNWQFSGAGGYVLAGTGTMSEWVCLIFQATDGGVLYPGDILIRRNGSEYTNFNNGSTQITPSSSANLFQLTAPAGGAIGVDFDVAEVIRWNRVLDAQERASVQAAMQARYPFLP